MFSFLLVNITTQSYDQDETMKATKTQNEQSDTKLGSTLSNDNLDTKQETSGSLEMPLQSGLINLSTGSFIFTYLFIVFYFTIISVIYIYIYIICILIL